MNFKDIEESLLALVLCTFGDLVAGLIMGRSSGKLAVLPALILLIPPSIGLRGNIYASLGSRLSSYLHTGRISPRFELNPRIAGNIYSSTFLLLLFSILNGFLAAQIAFVMGIAGVVLYYIKRKL
jgi:mgtE-like transporter